VAVVCENIFGFQIPLIGRLRRRCFVSREIHRETADRPPAALVKAKVDIGIGDGKLLDRNLPAGKG